MLTPRSVRLNKDHRADIVNAVMQEWERQNPPPKQSGQELILAAIVEEVKKHPSYRRTLKALEHFTSDEHEHMAQEASVRVRINDKNDNEKRTIQTGIPLSFAEKHELKGIGKQDRVTILEEGQCEEGDRFNHERYALCVTFMEGSYVTVILQDDHPALIEAEVTRKQMHEWKQERNKLKDETADLLNQYNTTNQLREGWPEIVDYLPPHIADPERAVTLPVLATSRLSERLGIKAVVLDSGSFDNN